LRLSLNRSKGKNGLKRTLSPDYPRLNKILHPEFVDLAAQAPQATQPTLVVSLGSKHGFKSGDKLKLYETVDTKDERGQVVFTEEKLAGEITLDAVQEERSKATYGGSAEVRSGWVVKLK
jgi:hypothetical protein